MSARFLLLFEIPLVVAVHSLKWHIFEGFSLRFAVVELFHVARH